RFRGRVLGAAVFIVLLQFLINLVGQLWDDVRFLRPFTVFYYYQPQQIILKANWGAALFWTTISSGKRIEPVFSINVILLIALVGTMGYMLALRRFCTRDLPAPL